MNKVSKLLLLFAVVLLHFNLTAQEISVRVTVNTPNIQLADPQVFKDLQGAIEELMNNQTWTNETFEIEERIQVTIQITIKEELSEKEFKADMQIQAVRPVYNSGYETVILSHNDKDVTFTYEQFQPLRFSRTQYVDNLTSILSFYSYVILGLDYDTFEPYGGEVYFQEAQNILSAIPPNVASAVKGWRSLDGNRNRYWIIESMLNPRVRPFRQAMYDYHRQGLDIMYEDPTAGRAIINDAIKKVGEVKQAYPQAMVGQMFANAKYGEIIEIFKKGTRSQKSSIKAVMGRVDAANASRYRQVGS